METEITEENVPEEVKVGRKPTNIALFICVALLALSCITLFYVFNIYEQVKPECEHLKALSYTFTKREIDTYGTIDTSPTFIFKCRSCGKEKRFYSYKSMPVDFVELYNDR